MAIEMISRMQQEVKPRVMVKVMICSATAHVSMIMSLITRWTYSTYLLERKRRRRRT